MSELLKFACPAPKCGRKFFTAEKLETHIKLRHPLISFSSTSASVSGQTNIISENTTNDNNAEENVKSETSQPIENKNVTEESTIGKKVGKGNNIISDINNIKDKTDNNADSNADINKKIENQKNENTTPNNIAKKEEKVKDINKKQVIQKSNKINNHEKINNKIKKEKNNNKTNKKINDEIKQSKVEKEIDKKIEEIEDKINKTEIDDMNCSKIKDDKEQNDKKEKLEKEKRKIILDNLYSKINSLENYFENETLELQKQFELSEIPVFDDINMEKEKDEDSQNEKISEKEEKETEEKQIDSNIKETKDNNIDIIKEEKDKDISPKNEKEKEKSNNNINIYDISESQKNYDIGKVIEITDDMIFKNTKFEDYDEFIELDLSKQNIASFMNKRNVPFEEFTELQKLDLSYNWMTYTYDIRFFTKLKELYINDNKIDDLTFSESLPNLEILNAENNQISYITPLAKCLNLKILKLALNKIEFLNSSLNTIKSLRKLEELTIKDNPFLTQLFAYKQYFIYNYQNILKLDEEDINDIDRDIAGRFVRENNPIYKNTTKRPMSSRPRQNQKIEKYSNNINLDDENKIEENEEEENEMESINNNLAQTQTTFRVGNAIISKEMFVPYKGRDKNNNKVQKNKKEENLINNEDKENKELKELKVIIKEQQEEIDNLNLELENINQLNKEYEIMIQDYKIKLEQKKINQKNNIKNKNINTIEKDKEKNKLLKELEMWKKEYCDLFNRTAKNNSLLNENDKKIKLLSNNLLQKHYNNNLNKKDDTKNNLYKSMPNNEIKQIINRPQTAKVKSNKSIDFDNLCEGIKIMYSRNNFADVLEEKTDDEEEEEKEEKEKKEEEKENVNEKNVKKTDDYDIINVNSKNEENDLVKENEPNFEEDDDILDEEIDEMFRKSCADLEKMREEIKFMNENIDKNKSNVNNNIGGKVKLNPVIVKKEYKSNLAGNKGIFGNINNKKI